jgi:hypothetical protein
METAMVIQTVTEKFLVSYSLMEMAKAQLMPKVLDLEQVMTMLWMNFLTIVRRLANMPLPAKQLPKLKPCYPLFRTPLLHLTPVELRQQLI